MTNIPVHKYTAVWRPAVINTVGVKFLPGFKNKEEPLVPRRSAIYCASCDANLGERHKLNCPVAPGSMV